MSLCGDSCPHRLTTPFPSINVQLYSFNTYFGSEHNLFSDYVPYKNIIFMKYLHQFE